MATPIICSYWILDMEAKLSAGAAGKFIAQLRVAALFEDCWTCYWLQRFLWQLELDAEPEACWVIQPLKVPRTGFTATAVAGLARRTSLSPNTFRKPAFARLEPRVD